jgi:hypothetical protein
MKTNVRRYGSLLLVMGAGVAAFALSLNVNPGSGRFASLGIPEATACWKAVSKPAENYCECEEADNYNLYSCSAHTSDVKECTVWWPVQIGCSVRQICDHEKSYDSSCPKNSGSGTDGGIDAPPGSGS